jgi:hypothetical protein
VLGKDVHLAVLVTRHVPHDKVNVIDARAWLEASLCSSEAGEGFP